MDVTGLDVNGAVHHQQPSLQAQLRTTLNLTPGYTWYANVLPASALDF
jgi:hypothetical protein